MCRFALRGRAGTRDVVQHPARRAPHLRLPLMPLVPAFGVVASISLIAQPSWETWARSGVWLLIGLVPYSAQGRKHPLLDPDSPHHRQRPTTMR